jgi:hypothetical protein
VAKSASSPATEPALGSLGLVRRDGDL